MALVIYHHHTIVSTAICEEVSGKWKYIANPHLQRHGNLARETYSIRCFAELFSRLEDAENAGLEAAKNWVEEKCRKAAS
jgi:hypothetical protein